MTPYPILHDLSGKVNQKCRTKEISKLEKGKKAASKLLRDALRLYHL